MRTKCKILVIFTLLIVFSVSVFSKATVYDTWERSTALGLIEGETVVTVFGRSESVGTTEEVIWDNGGGYIFLDEGVEATVSLVSSSANDDSDPAGTGAHIVRIEGLNAAKEAVNETLSLNGVTPVVSTVLFNRVNFVFAVIGGSNESNVGTLTVTSNAAGTPIQAVVLPGNNRSESCIYSTPASDRILFINSSFGVEGNKQATIATKAKIPSAFVNTFFVPIIKHEFGAGVQEIRSIASGPTGSLDIIATGQAASGTVKISCLLQFHQIATDNIN